MDVDDCHQKVEVPMVHGWSRLYGETRTFSTTLPPDLERTGLITKKEYQRIIGKVNSIWNPFLEGVEHWVFPQRSEARLAYLFGSVFLYIFIFAFEENITRTKRQKRDRKLEDTLRRLMPSGNKDKKRGPRRHQDTTMKEKRKP